MFTTTGMETRFRKTYHSYKKRLNGLEKMKKIQAAKTSASLMALKLNFPMLIAIVFSTVLG
jgi:hypothetical protein